MLKRTNLDEEVYDILLKDILDGKYEPGQKIRVEDMAKEMGISCTPVLTALRKLEYDGLLTSRTRSGFYMPVYDKAAVDDISNALSVMYFSAFSEIIGNNDDAYIDKLEELARLVEDAYKAKDFAEYTLRDRELHRAIVDYLHNDRIMQFYTKLHRQVAIYQQFNSSSEERGIDRMHPESHFLWCELLRKRDLMALKDALKAYNKEINVHPGEIY